MKNLTMIMGAALILTGCAAHGPALKNCTNPPISRITIIFTKNSEIRVSPPTKTTYQGNILRFKLTGESGTTVKVTGKSTGPDASWIEGDGLGGSFFDVCVDPAQAEDTYGYNIEVVGVGTLDPRVIVRR